MPRQDRPELLKTPQVPGALAMHQNIGRTLFIFPDVQQSPTYSPVRADLSSWEFAQKLAKKLPEIQADGVQIVAVGLGNPDNARRFAQTVGFPLQLLYAGRQPRVTPRVGSHSFHH